MDKMKCLILACLLLVSSGAGARSMKDLLVSMPDSLVPFLDKNLRLEFAELQEMGVKAEVQNLLGDTSVMDTLTTDFLQLRTSSVSTLQMKRLPVAGGDSILCVVTTFAGPEKESELNLYTQNWKPLPSGIDLQSQAMSLVQKPDTMSEERFVELKRMIEPRMVYALLLQHEDAIVVRLSLPLLSEEEKKQVNAIKMQRKFNWGGRTFKES